MDDIDRAQVEQDRELAHAHARHVLQTTPSEPQQCVDGVVVCRDCEEPIPEKRLAALPNAVRCVDCADIHARR